MSAAMHDHDSTLNLDAALAAARERLDEARALEAEAVAEDTAETEALMRGQPRLAEANAEVARLSGLDDEAEQRHARRLENQAREGKSGPLPMLVPSDKHLAAQISAIHTQRAAMQMVASLEQAKTRSAQKLAAAKSAHRAAAAAVTDAESEISAAKVLHHEAELLREGAVLHGYVADDRNVPLNRLAGHQLSISARVQRALDVLKRVEAPTLKDDLNKPMSELRRTGPAPSEFLAERRAALTDGAAPDPAAEPRDAAA